MKRSSILKVATFIFLLAVYFDLSASDFSDVDASQIVVTQIYKLEAANYDAWSKQPQVHPIHPRYSPDGHLFVYTKYSPNATTKKAFVSIIRDTKTRKVVDTFYGGLSPAWSPDGMKILYCSEGVLAVYDRKSKKATTLDISVSGTSLSCEAKYLWVSDSYVYSFYGESRNQLVGLIDLDKLKKDPVYNEKNGVPGKYDEAQKLIDSKTLSGHKKCHIYDDSYSELGKGLPVFALVVANKDNSYARSLFVDVSVHGHDAAPDLTSVLVTKRDGLYIAYLGTRNKPILNFRVDLNLSGLQVNSYPPEKAYHAFVKLSKQGQIIWGSVYGPKKNPLNGKIVGPDPNDFKGYVTFTRLGQGDSDVRVSGEFKQIADGDILSGMSGNLGLGDAWATLKQAK